MKRLTLQIITALFLLTTIASPLSAAAQTTSTQTAGQTTTSGFWATLGNYIGGATIGAPLKVIDGIMELVVIPFAGFILFLAGQLLDYSVQYSLNIFSAVSGAKSAILVGWTVIRDVFNMMFIFVIIWIAIETMLDIGKWHGKQILVKIITAAILINFSFFLTEVIIDAGNVFGAWFYNGIIGTLAKSGAAVTTACGGTTGVTCTTSLSAGISNAMGMWSIYSSQGMTGFLGSFSLSDITQRLITAYLRVGIIGFSAYIFAYVAVLFVARTVSLLFSLVTSPVGFAGSILPQTQEYATDWWNDLTKNVLLAPVFLLFLYVIIAFVNSSLFQNTAGGTGVLGSSGLSSINPVQYFKYFLLAGMLLFALKAAKKQSGALGKMLEKSASQLGQLAAGAVVGVATGGTSMALQATLGRAGSAIANSETAKNLASGNGRTGIMGTLYSKVGKGIQGVGNKAATSSFDASGTVKEQTGVATPSWAPWLQTNKGGYAGAIKEKMKLEQAAAKELYATPEQEAVVKKAGDQKIPRAELAVSKTAAAQNNLKDRNRMTVRQEKLKKDEKDYDKQIAFAIANKDTATQASFEAAKRANKAEQSSLEQELKTRQDEYNKMVETEVSRLVSEEAKTNSGLAEALKATKRVENYAELTEKASIKKVAVSVATGVGAGITGPVGMAFSTKIGSAVSGIMTKENKATAKAIRDDKKKSADKQQKELEKIVKMLNTAAGTTPGTTPPTTP